MNPMHYVHARKRGLTKGGIGYWVGKRLPACNNDNGYPPLLTVDVDDPEIGLPKYLQK